MATDDSGHVSVVVKSEGQTPPPEPTDVSILDFFRRIYQFFYSKTVGLTLILAMAVLVLLGVIIGQAPKGTYSNPAEKEQFLAQAQDKYGGWASVLDFLGLFHVFSSPIFLAVTGLLALSIIACTTHRIPQLWQRYRHPRTHVSPRFYDRARYRGSFEANVGIETTANVREYLRSKHFRVIADDEPGGLYADRFSWGGFGTVLAHASFVIILAAFVISSSGGIDEVISVPVGGDPVAVGHGTGLSLAASSFEATYNDDGRATDYVSRLQVSADGTTVADRDVRVNEPLRYQGVKFHQSTFGIAADVVAKDNAGKTLYDGSVPLEWSSTDGTMSIGGFELPEQNLEVQVAVAASGSTGSGLAAGQALVTLLELGQTDPLTMNTVEQGSAVDIGDISVTFEREREYTGIMVRQDPGAIWMWIGSALLVIGMTITFTCRHRRIWIRVDAKDNRIYLASPDKEDLSFERRFTDLVYDMADVFSVEDAKK